MEHCRAKRVQRDLQRAPGAQSVHARRISFGMCRTGLALVSPALKMRSHLWAAPPLRPACATPISTRAGTHASPVQQTKSRLRAAYPHSPAYVHPTTTRTATHASLVTQTQCRPRAVPRLQPAFARLTTTEALRVSRVQTVLHPAREVPFALALQTRFGSCKMGRPTARRVRKT